MPPATRPRRLTRKGVLVQQALLWCWHADVAQLVEHHLAKVRVAGSNPVVRSEVPGAVSDVLATLLDSPRGSCAPRSAP